MWGLGLALVTGCASSEDSTRRIAVLEQNALGVKSLEIERLADGGNAVFVLKALSASDQELASVRLTTGEIAELTQWLPGTGSLGAELIVSVAGVDSRSFTRSQDRFDLTVAGREQATVDFLQLATVSKTLAREAKIIVLEQPHGTGSAESQYARDTVAACPANIMNTAPIAKQCCLATAIEGYQSTYHVGVKGTGTAPPTFAQQNTLVTRTRNPSGQSCRTSAGSSSCTGQQCFYGPNGYGLPSAVVPPIDAPYGYTRKKTSNDPNRPGEICYGTHATLHPAFIVFADVQGTFGNGAGCCNGVATTAQQGCCAGTVYTTAGNSCCNGVVQQGTCAIGGTPDQSSPGAWDY